MMTQVNFDSIGGGGNFASGDVPISGTQTGLNEEYVIDTGLPSISSFFLMARSSYSTMTKYHQILAYCEAVNDISSDASDRYDAAYAYPGGSGTAYGLYENTSNGYTYRITDITGGVVTIRTAANTYYGNTDIMHWVAEA